MKKISLLILAMLLGITGVNAKSRTTTLWEGTDTGTDIEVAKSELVKGATLNLTFNWLGSEGAQFSCFWWDSSTSEWVKIKNYQWVDNGNSYSFTLTDDEFDAITNDKLCFKTEAPEKMTIAKITQIETLVPTSTGDNLLSENWTASWTAKTFAAQSSAKIGDVIRFSYSAPGGWSYFQFNILDAYGNADAFENTSSNVATSIETAADLYFDFEITNISDLQKIQNEGFGIKGDKFTLTSVQLLTYADSYDAVSVTIGSDGIATWSHTKNLDFTGTGITAYYASAVTKGTVTLTSTATTWNYCGYILKGDEGTYTVKVVADEDASYPSATYLKGQTGEGTVAGSTSDTYHYIFAKDEGGNIGFYKLTANHTLGAHKAYLETDTDITPTSGSETARAIRLVFDGGNITDINTITEKKVVTKNDGITYNLNGQVVTNPSKGIYIKNGKKYVVK